ncbi:MAG: hypothetical protein KBC96_14980 [Armatimonadetes bacterium]|nr:hypothetical protein [Armatimonadota bacterium]
MRRWTSLAVSVIAVSIWLLVPADADTEYSPDFAIENRAYVPGGTHTALSSLFAVDNRTLGGGNSSTGFTGLFTVDNTGQAAIPGPAVTEAISPYSNDASDQLLRGQLHFHSIQDIDKLVGGYLVGMYYGGPPGAVLAWMRSTWNLNEVVNHYAIPGHYDFVAISDHDYFITTVGAGIWDPGADSTSGVVWGRRSTELTPIDSEFPHVLALGMNSGTSVSGLSQGLPSSDWYAHVGLRIEHIKSNGGLALIAHPNDKGKKVVFDYDFSVSPERLRYLYDHYTPDGIAVNDAQELWNSALRAGYTTVWGYSEEDFHPHQGVPIGGKAWVGVPGTAADSWETIEDKLVSGNYYSYWMNRGVAGESLIPGMRVTHSISGGHPLIRVEINGYSDNASPRVTFVHAKGESAPTYQERTETWNLVSGGYVYNARADYQCRGYERFVRAYAELEMSGGRTLCMASQPITITASNPVEAVRSSTQAQSTSSSLIVSYLATEESPPPPAAGYIGHAFEVSTSDGLVPPDATLELSYEGEDLSAIGRTQYLAIYFYDEGANEWVKVGGTIDPEAATIRCPITALGKYTVSADLPEDTVVPQIWIDNPSHGAQVTADTTVRATVNDDLGAWTVSFYMNGHLVAKDWNALDFWTANLRVADYCEGDWTLSAVAEDRSGNTEATEIPVHVDSATPPPTVSITSPTGGANLSGVTAVAGNCWDDVAVAEVGLYADDMLVGFGDLDGSSGWSAEIDTTYLANGSRTLTAVVHDYPGNEAEATVSVNLNNGEASIGSLRGTADGQFVRTAPAVVTAGTTDMGGAYFYVESADRSAGIRVASDVVVSEGTEVRVAGTLGTSNGERQITASDVFIASTGNQLPGPLGNIERSLMIGLDPTGLLVRTWGKVTQVGDGYLYIDDGSGLKDGTSTGAEENVGVRVICDPAGYSSGDKVEVTGISSCFQTPSGIARRILIRKPEDVRKLIGP